MQHVTNTGGDYAQNRDKSSVAFESKHPHFLLLSRSALPQVCLFGSLIVQLVIASANNVALWGTAAPPTSLELNDAKICQDLPRSAKICQVTMKATHVAIILPFNGTLEASPNSCSRRHGAVPATSVHHAGFAGWHIGLKLELHRRKCDNTLFL